MAARAPDSWEQFDNNGFNMPVMSEAALQLKSPSRFPCFALCFKGEMLSYYQEAIFNSSPQKNKMESPISDTEQQNIKSRESMRPLWIFGGAKGSTGEMMLCLTQQNRRNVAQ